ncbi:HPP family protein [Salinilacihabitans rarus]|uniref:HPP family protein n=1 Tax=Salinilacihabitans rarus TaxID=2961596 RepID=UPI0020C8D8C6|nr:HPP family protein [Salinilacihabitans rarus]
MLRGVAARCRAVGRRLRRVERRGLDAFLRWIEHTGNLLHLSVLVFVPLSIAVVTWLSNATAVVSFLVFPPLASGTYTLFADPEGPYSTPGTFVGGMTAGALCGWLALAVADALSLGGGAVSPAGAALGIFLTGAVTWALDLEEPTAFSTALLVFVTGNAQLAYVLGIAVSSAFVAAAFVLWRDRFYQKRARYLYRTTKGDDHVLVPMRDGGETAARFAATLASAHDAGKVVLFDVVDEGDDEDDPEARAEAAGRRLDAVASRLTDEYDVPCEVVVAVDGHVTSGAALHAARRNNCDLIVTPYEEHPRGGLSSFVKGVFDGEIDAVAFRPSDGTERWRRALVAVRGATDAAHGMIDFALRATAPAGLVGVCTCIDRESRRRDAESTLSDLVEAFDGRFETQVANAPVEDHLERISPRYDVLFVGSSTDRSGASRFVSPPTFERLRDVEADVAIVHRGRH